MWDWPGTGSQDPGDRGGQGASRARPAAGADAGGAAGRRRRATVPLISLSSSITVTKMRPSIRTSSSPAPPLCAPNRGFTAVQAGAWHSCPTPSPPFVFHPFNPVQGPGITHVFPLLFQLLGTSYRWHHIIRWLSNLTFHPARCV